jgi:hypothetical protein
VELVTCGTTNFNYSDPAMIITAGINTRLCVKDKTKLNMRGVFTSAVCNFIDVRLYACENSTTSNVTCASVEEATDYFSGVIISLS